MLDRIRLALKVLVTPHVIVVTKSEQFSTFNNATCVQDNNRIYIEVRL